MTEALLTQREIEEQMYTKGIARAEAMLSKAEDAGRAHQNPYAKRIMEQFVLPLAEKIKEDVAPTGKPGRSAAHMTLLRPLDEYAVAFLAIRVALNVCMQQVTKEHNAVGTQQGASHRTVAHRIGSTINAELVLTQLEDGMPELYHTIANDLARRLSKDERHRVTLMRVKAKQAGISWVEWPIGAYDQVGFYLLGLLEQMGLVSIVWPGKVVTKGMKQPPAIVTLSESVLDMIDKVRGFVSITQPMYGPCVEPPIDWTSWTSGGFHTQAMRRALPRLVKCHPNARDFVLSEPAPTVFAAANMLQRTAWQVNRDVYDVVMGMAAAGIASKEVIARNESPKPERPEWLDTVAKEDMTPEQAAEFKAWKIEVTEWHTQRKLQGVRASRFYAATRSAETFMEYPRLHFVYFADSRGRFYPLTYGINPQGSDLQKALLRFAVGKPLDTPEAIRWFHILGANKYGFDKATLSERFMWAHERRGWIQNIVRDPLSNREWLDAGDPFQFLAWCFEYADWVRDPDLFVSHLPVGLDGSCNGLQNLSAMLRDEIGGRATNLTNNEVMEDIYRRVAEAATVRLAEKPFEDDARESIRLRWLSHGVNRSVVKRSVMTTPYGVTKRSATDYVISDYLAEGCAPEFARTEYRLAARVLMEFVWPAIGDVVVKGREAMSWLSRGGRRIVKSFDADTEPVIVWRTPSGFPASQAYFEANEHRINTRLAGTTSIKIVALSESDKPDPSRHSSGIAPNFVHSLDASHLHRVVARSSSLLIDAVAAVHDDYGTHAADTQALFDLIRKEFVAMYEDNDPVMDFFNRYPAVGAPPAKGSLNIKEVLQSDFFFS